MKVIKLDRRNAGFPKWKYALHFGQRIRHITPRAQYAQVFTQLYGPSSILNPDREAFNYSKPMWLYNEHWHNDNKRGRIYFNNEADITAVELMMIK